MSVYFMEAGGRIKIGHTSQLRTRLVTVRCACPVSVTLLGWMSGGRPEERALHERFRAAHSHGEWFDATDELRAVAAGAPHHGEPPAAGDGTDDDELAVQA